MYTFFYSLLFCLFSLTTLVAESSEITNDFIDENESLDCNALHFQETSKSQYFSHKNKCKFKFGRTPILRAMMPSALANQSRTDIIVDLRGTIEQRISFSNIDHMNGVSYDSDRNEFKILEMTQGKSVRVQYKAHVTTCGLDERDEYNKVGLSLWKNDKIVALEEIQRNKVTEVDLFLESTEFAVGDTFFVQLNVTANYTLDTGVSFLGEFTITTLP